ncbi:hypothetical protein BC830DRAFT_934159 [Chytriomyces sp. MP71]|nr:hypothetical protein BC830DRAFT_934159 [Chytriomyces sp. MP71]
MTAMMGQSKLSSFQQRMLDNLVNSGSSLPAKPTPGLAPRPSSAASHASSATSLLSMGDVEAERKQMKKRAMKAGLTAPRSGVRSLATILESDAFKEEVYRPGVSKNFETEKKKLQKFMETDGGKIAVDDAEEAEDAAVDASSQIAHGRRRGLGKGHFARAAEGNGVSMEMAELDEFDMVFKEIEERKQWLDDMISLGRGDVYRQQIQNEIATRIKRLEQIDRERATAVQP